MSYSKCSEAIETDVGVHERKKGLVPESANQMNE